MHAMLISFTSSADLSDLEQPFGDYAKGLRTVEGLISKTWLHDGRTLGGFHLFTSREAADAYLASEMVAGLRPPRRSPTSRSGTGPCSRS